MREFKMFDSIVYWRGLFIFAPLYNMAAALGACAYPFQRTQFFKYLTLLKNQPSSL